MNIFHQARRLIAFIAGLLGQFADNLMENTLVNGPVIRLIVPNSPYIIILKNNL